MQFIYIFCLKLFGGSISLYVVYEDEEKKKISRINETEKKSRIYTKEKKKILTKTLYGVVLVNKMGPLGFDRTTS